MTIHPFRPDLSMIITAVLAGFSITMLNSIITTVVLLLTTVYWIQKNWRMFKNKGKDDLK